MEQKSIPEYDGKRYKLEVGLDILKELDERTKSDVEGFNNLQEVGSKLKVGLEDLATKADAVNVVIAAQGIKPFQTKQAAIDFYTANPPAQDVLFQVTDGSDAGNYTWLVSTAEPSTRRPIDPTENSNSLTINQGKDFPFVGYGDVVAATAARVREVFLDGSIIIDEAVSEIYDFGISAVYKQSAPAARGSGFYLRRKPKAGGAIGYNKFYTGANSADSNANLQELLKIEKGGIQTLRLRNNAFGVSIVLVMDTDKLFVNDIVDINYNTTTRGTEFAFNPAVTSIGAQKPKNETVNTYDTFREALAISENGTFRVGQYLARPKVSSPQLFGVNADYQPAKVGDQFSLVGANNELPTLPRKSKVIRVVNPSGDYCEISSISKSGYVYFSRSDNFFRTKEELTESLVTYQNTKFEKVTLPDPMPESLSPRPYFRNVYEMENGELLIECRNGERAAGNTNWNSAKIQLYVTNGFKDMSPVIDSDGIDTFNLTVQDLTKVAEYINFTSTRQGWAIDMHANNIVIGPYGQNRTGKVLFSDDYGMSFNTIFNMDVPDVFVDTRPNGGSVGAWPLPENLDPQMPPDMWDRGANIHMHGVIYDKYFKRIWVLTGDAGNDPDGVTAIWYTDDKGVNWTRISTNVSSADFKYDALGGFQGIRGVATADYVLFGSDSGTNGYIRYNRGSKDELPVLEAAYHTNENGKSGGGLKLIEASTYQTQEGVFGMFHLNSDETLRAKMVFTPDGVNFEEFWIDDVSDDIRDHDSLSFNTWAAPDLYGNVLIKRNVLEGPANESGGVIKLFK